MPDMAESKHTRRLVETSLVFLAFLLPGYASLQPAGTETLKIPALLLPTLFSAVPQAGLLIYILFVQGEIGRPELGLSRPRAKEVPIALAAALAMVIVLLSAELVLAALPESTRAALTRGTRFRLDSWLELPAAAAFCLIAAAREELLYRAYLPVRLCDLGLPPAVAVLAASVLFATAHAYQGPIAVALAMTQGLILAAVFGRSRALWVPVLAHTLHNVVALVATLVSGHPI